MAITRRSFLAGAAALTASAALPAVAEEARNSATVRTPQGSAEALYSFTTQYDAENTEGNVLWRRLTVDPDKIANPRLKSEFGGFFNRTFGITGAPERANWKKELVIISSVERSREAPYAASETEFDILTARITSPDGNTVHEYRVEGDPMVARLPVRGRADEAEINLNTGSDFTAHIPGHRYRVLVRGSDGVLRENGEGGGGFPGESGYNYGDNFRLIGRVINRDNAVRLAGIAREILPVNGAQFPSRFARYFGPEARARAVADLRRENAGSPCPTAPTGTNITLGDRRCTL